MQTETKTKRPLPDDSELPPPAKASRTGEAFDIPRALLQAVCLNDLIADPASKLPAIGDFRDSSLQLHSSEDEGDDEYEDQDQDETEPDRFIKRLLCPESLSAVGLKELPGDVALLDHEVTIKLGGFGYTGKLSGLGGRKTLDRLYAAAAESGFGHVDTQTTRVDAKVRQAREVKAGGGGLVLADDSLPTKLAAAWASVAGMSPARVRVELYKLNLYGEGGHFAKHRDTPDTDLVGTILVNVVQAGCGGRLVLREGGQEMEDEGVAGTWSAFYPDTVHEITKVNIGRRVSLAFKVYAAAPDGAQQQQPSDCKASRAEVLGKGLARLLGANGGVVGVLLRHSYTISSTALQGQDAAAVRALEQLPNVKTAQVSVVVRYHKVDHAAYDGDGVERTATVHALPADYVDAVCAGETKACEFTPPWAKDGKKAEVTFYGPHNEGTLWSKHKDEGAMMTGNESRPAEKNSVYLSRALVLWQ